MIPGGVDGGKVTARDATRRERIVSVLREGEAIEYGLEAGVAGWTESCRTVVEKARAAIWR